MAILKLIFLVHFCIFKNFNITITLEIGTLCFEQSYISSSVSQAILDGLPSSLHKMGLIF